MNGQHNYHLEIKWTGNTGIGTSTYEAYERSYTIRVDHKTEIQGSSDPAFRGDPTKHNPEELLIASVSSCHMLWYLHLCSVAGIIITDYVDHATGTMLETSNGGGKFTQITLYPSVTIKESSMAAKAILLHQKAGELCFVANSLNFPVLHIPTCKVESAI